MMASCRCCPLTGRPNWTEAWIRAQGEKKLTWKPTNCHSWQYPIWVTASSTPNCLGFRLSTTGSAHEICCATTQIEFKIQRSTLILYTPFFIETPSLQDYRHSIPILQVPVSHFRTSTIAIARKEEEKRGNHHALLQSYARPGNELLWNQACLADS